MSLQTAANNNEKANYVRSNFDAQNELNLAENYSSKNRIKMLLPNDKKCFQSFHNKLFEPHDQLKDDCSKSFDILTFKKNRSSAINLNRNLITLNNSLFINDTLNDSLQWCLESSYQNGQKNLFDNELNGDVYTNPFECKSDGNPIEQQQSFKSDSSRFNSNQNYELLSRKIDANLAEMDIETFSLTNQFSNLLNEINNKFSSTEEVINEVGKLDCSVDDSLISEINERANALRYEINGTRLKPVLNSSFTVQSNQTDDESTMHNESESACTFDKNEIVNLESVGISVDSLDNSCFEQKCAEVVNKCKKPDKSKYTLAFEQMEDSTNESLLNYERYLTKIKRNEIYLNKLFNDLNRRLHRDQLSVDKLSRSEYSANGSGQGDEQINQLNQSSQNPIKLTKSLQNDLVQSLRQSFDQTNCEYVPIFNLNNSFNSESSSIISTPKNLIQIFSQNKNSPNSSSSGHLSGSLEELNKHQSLVGNHNLSNENEDKNDRKKIDRTERISTRNTNKQTSNKTIEVQTLESLNQNNSKEKSNSTESSSNPVAGNLYATFRNATDTDTLSTINNLKIYHNRKTSPIREEDEHESSLTVKEVKKYTSFQNVTAGVNRLNQNKIDTSLQVNDNEQLASRKTDCPRSISMNDFSNETKRPNLIKQYSLKNSNTTQHNEHSNRPTMSRTNRNSKECSISSGYLSSGGSNNMFVENNRKHFQQQQRLFQHYHQQSTNCEDKQVQTSIYENTSLPAAQQTPILINELPNSKNFCTANSNAPIYVYYPNYSLPDLNFIFSQNGSFQNIHLSPTKFQPASFECSCSTVKRRKSSATTNRANLQTTIKGQQQVSSKSRPKSTGDFEKLTKESLNHIKDWESLKTLLPDDIKELIKTLNLRSDDEDDERKMKSKTTSNTPTSTKTFQKAIQNSSIKLRSKPVSRVSSIDKNQQTDQHYSLSANQGNKRFSLQEPIYRMDDCVLNCSTNTHSDAGSCCSNHQTPRRGMIKSATMNMPIVIQQQQQRKQQIYNNMHSKMFYQAQCHHSSCCNLNQQQICQQQMMNMGSCCHCSHGSHCSNHFAANQFNQCSSDNYPLMNNFSTSHCQINPSLIIDQQYHNNAYYYQQQLKMTSPMKPCNPISEQNEENDFESLNFLIENENEDGELDFDRLLNCKVAKKVANKSNKTENVSRKRSANMNSKNAKLIDCSKEFQNSKENFNDLKNQWERIAKSSKPVQTTPTTPTTKKSITSDHQQLQKITQQSAIKSRPVTSIRQSHNQTKSKVINRRSRSKSPEKSNKEVIILTKKASNKPQVPLKPVNSNTLTRTKKQINKSTGANQQQNTLNPTYKKPVRPSSFNSQFKSMIPIAKILNKSPPNK